MKECDRLSLVSYDTQVYLDFGLTAMNRANKDKTKSLIGKLRDGSCTNLCGGLMKGTQIKPVISSSDLFACVRNMVMYTSVYDG